MSLGPMREKNFDRGVFALLALNSDRSFVFINDFSDNGKAKTRSLVLGGKKGVEDSLQVFLADPATRVPHLDAKVLVVLVDLDVDGSSCFHGLRRVDENVQEGPVELAVIC